MSEQPINQIIDTAMEKLRSMAQSDTVIGDPISMPNGVTAIPVCKISVGFASGGSDLPNKGNLQLFGGGAGGGISVTPIAFLVTSKDGVKLLQLDSVGRTADNIVRTVPEVIDKLTYLIRGDKNEAEQE